MHPTNYTSGKESNLCACLPATACCGCVNIEAMDSPLEKSCAATQAAFNFVALLMKPAGTIEEKQTDDSLANQSLHKERVWSTDYTRLGIADSAIVVVVQLIEC